MSKFSLLQLGSAAQKLFNMQDGYLIIESANDDAGRYRVVDPRPDYRPGINPSRPYDYEDVSFQKFVDQDTAFWVAYSRRFNILVIKNAGTNIPRVADDTRGFPIQADYGSGHQSYIPWWLAEVAYKFYAACYGKRQTLERLAERGGFGRSELVGLLRQQRVPEPNCLCPADGIYKGCPVHKSGSPR